MGSGPPTPAIPALSAKLMEDGYGRFCVGRFEQTLEYRSDVFPEQPQAGPFFANLGGFLMVDLDGPVASA